MTQGRTDYESMISRGMDEGLELWEAVICYYLQGSSVYGSSVDNVIYL